MSAPAPSPQSFTKADAKRARVAYQHVSQIVNLLGNRLIQTLDHDRAKAFKPSVFQTLHALHGMLNGREVSTDNPHFRAHIFTAPHFGFQDQSGDEIADIQADKSLSPDEKERQIADICARTEDRAARLVCRRLNDLADAEAACGRQLVIIRRADGVTQKLTAYEGHPLLDAAEALYFAARNSPDYAKNPSAAITAELLDEAVARLPVIERAASVTATGERAEMDAGDLMTDSILQGMWTKIINAADRALVKEFDTGGDPELVAKKYAAKVEKMGRDIKQRLARERLSAFYAMGEEDTDTTPKSEGVKAEGGEVGGNNNAGQDEGGKPDAPAEVWGDKFVPPTESQDVETQEVIGKPFSENENLRLRYALEYAAQDIAVLPLWGVADGICDCPEGSECRTAGKHPYSKLARNGVYSASTDEKSIRSWFEKDSRINLGVAMGGPLNLICVDIDPRNDGDASYCDLIEAYGENAFPETFTVKTGGGGWHKLYRLPEEIKPKTGELKGKLAPGIDTKGSGGQIVAPGSVHASGRFYEVEDNTYIADAPEWIVAALRKSAAGEQPEIVIDFQAHRDRKRAGVSGAVIVEGERNERLFKVGCALWGKGEVSGKSELFSRLLDVNMERVNPPLAPPEVSKIAASITRYPLGMPIQEGAA
jgi:hypothetical protein